MADDRHTSLLVARNRRPQPSRTAFEDNRGPYRRAGRRERVRPNRACLLMAGLGLALGAFNGSAGGGEGVTISDGERMAADGWTRHKVTSPFLGRATCVDVLLPDPLKPGRKYPVLYVLPVGGEWDAQNLRYRHHWHTGWVAKALEIMLQNDAGAKQNDNKQHRKEKP